MNVLAGNDIVIIWSIVRSSGDDTLKEDLSNADLRVFLSNAIERKEMPFSVVKNEITIFLSGKVQRTGSYSLEAIWSINNGRNWSRAQETNVVNFVLSSDKVKSAYLCSDEPIRVRSRVQVGTNIGLNYELLVEKPSINNIVLSGDKSLEDLGIQPAGDYVREETDPTVPLWAKQPDKPSYTAKEVGALPDTTKYVAEETDPTVPQWAKQPDKPNYTAKEVGALPDTTIIPEIPEYTVIDANYVHTDNNFSNEEKNKLEGLSNYDDTDIRNDFVEADKAVLESAKQYADTIIGGGGGGNSGSAPVVRGTYEEIKALADGNQLIAGNKYIITDYQCIYKQPITGLTMTGDRSFMLKLTAHSTNTFLEKVEVLGQYKWECWYDINNNSTKYVWAIPTGKGVITRLIDEYKNDCCYDFKNVKFRRWKITGFIEGHWIVDKYLAYDKSMFYQVTNDRISFDLNDYKDYYTFTDFTDDSDASSIEYNGALESINKLAKHNTIHAAYGKDKHGSTINNSIALNNIVMGKGSQYNTFRMGSCDSTLGDSFGMYWSGNNVYVEELLCNTYADGNEMSLNMCIIDEGFTSNKGDLFSCVIGRSSSNNEFDHAQNNWYGMMFMGNYEKNTTSNKYGDFCCDNKVICLNDGMGWCSVKTNNSFSNNLLILNNAIDFTLATLVYGREYSCTVQPNKEGVEQLSYVDENNQLVITDPTI